MDEQTSLSDNIFEGVTEADIAEMTESDTTIEDDAQSEEATTTDTEVKTEAVEQMHKLKYLGEEKEVTHEEMTVLAQKGMDYDRIRSKYDELQGLIKTAAGGKTVEEFIQDLNAQNLENAIQKRADELLMTGNYSEQGARETAELEMKLQGQEAGLKQQREFETKAKAVGEFAMANADFRNAFPDGNIAKEIIDAMNAGKTISEAWDGYQLAQERKSNAELKKQIAQLEVEIKNKNSAAPSVSTKTATETDPFLQGLFGN